MGDVADCVYGINVVGAPDLRNRPTSFFSGQRTNEGEMYPQIVQNPVVPPRYGMTRYSTSYNCGKPGHFVRKF